MLDSYVFGFNGKEQDNEVSGNGNHYDYGFRNYNTRLARFFSVDPLTAKYPMLSSYQFASNTPIMADDLDGAEARVRIKTVNVFSGFTFDKEGNRKTVKFKQTTTTLSYPGNDGFSKYGNQRKYTKYGTLNVVINQVDGEQVGKTQIYAPEIQVVAKDYVVTKVTQVNKKIIQPLLYQMRNGEYQQEEDKISYKATAKGLKVTGTVFNYLAIPATLLGPEATAGCLSAGRYFNYTGTGMEIIDDGVHGNGNAVLVNAIGTGVGEVLGGTAGKTTERLVGGKGILSTAAEVVTGEKIGNKTDEAVKNARKEKE